jgi:hypothetical protein
VSKLEVRKGFYPSTIDTGSSTVVSAHQIDHVLRHADCESGSYRVSPHIRSAVEDARVTTGSGQLPTGLVVGRRFGEACGTVTNPFEQSRQSDAADGSSF